MSQLIIVKYCPRFFQTVHGRGHQVHAMLLRWKKQQQLVSKVVPDLLDGTAVLNRFGGFQPKKKTKKKQKKTMPKLKKCSSAWFFFGLFWFFWFILVFLAFFGFWFLVNFVIFKSYDRIYNIYIDTTLYTCKLRQ